MRWLLGVTAVASLLASPLAAQTLHPELRFDVVGPAPAAPQLGAGVTYMPGLYTRITAAAGWGPQPEGARDRGAWRGDLLVRVTLDPFRQQRFALALGGGLTVRRQANLALLADLEGPAISNWVPVLQVGVSGGARAGLILRRVPPNRR